MIDVVVLAGGVDDGEIAAQTGTIHRPLLEVGGKPILQHVLAALGGAPSLDRVALVAPEPVLAIADNLVVDIPVVAGPGILDNLLLGLEALASSARTGAVPEHVLVITGDLPLVTAASVEDFLARSLALSADVTYPIIPKAFSEAKFPEGKRTYVRLREGTFTGGNATVMTRAFADNSRDLIARLYEYRKSPVKLAALFGPGFLLKLVLGRLTLPALEARASAIVRGRVRAVVTEFAELGFDVDKMDDLRVAREARSEEAKRR